MICASSLRLAASSGDGADGIGNLPSGNDLDAVIGIFFQMFCKIGRRSAEYKHMFRIYAVSLMKFMDCIDRLAVNALNQLACGRQYGLA